MQPTSSILRAKEAMRVANQNLDTVSIVLWNKIRRKILNGVPATEADAFCEEVHTLIDVIKAAEEAKEVIYQARQILTKEYCDRLITNCCGVEADDCGHGYAHCPKCKEMANLETYEQAEKGDAR